MKSGHRALVAFLVFERARHGIGDYSRVGADIFRFRQDFNRLRAIGVVVGIEPHAGADERFGDRENGVRIFCGQVCRHAEYFLRIVFPDFVVGDDRNTDALEYCRLVPGFADAIAEDGPGFQVAGICGGGVTEIRTSP